MRPSDADVAFPAPGSGDWVWPWWLDRQLDPASAAWQPADLAGHNRSGRNWTVIGIPDGHDRWLVDRRGLLAPLSGAWALDWWVGADDRWRLPSREASVRQSLVGSAPVIETVLRVRGGEVAARHWAVPGDDADLVVVEIDNSSAAPVALALALRPVGPVGPTGMQRVAVEGGRLYVDGSVVLCADVAPRQSAVSGGSGGDVAGIVLANATPDTRHADIVCPSGWATAAMVWPLGQRSSLRVELPGAARRSGPGSGSVPTSTGPRTVRPGPVATARGWSARVTRRTRLDLPAGPLASALEAQRRHLLLAGAVDAAPSRVEAAQVAAALSTAGLREEAAGHLDAWLDDQTRRGLLGRDDVETAATLWALEVWSRTGEDRDLLARSPVAIARAAERFASPSHLDDPVSAAWSAAGAAAAGRMLAVLGEREAAAKAQRWSRARTRALMACLEGALGATFERTTEAALLAVGLGVLAPRHRLAGLARAAARSRLAGIPAGAVAGAPPLIGLRPALTLTFALAAALAGDHPDAAIQWVLSVASPTWTWPTVVAPRLGTGSHGSGHDPVVAAAMWTCGRALLVADVPPATPAGESGVDIVPSLPADWTGIGLEVHGMATAVGPLAYAVRWHGDRPAILWEIEGTGPVPVVTAGGLDPTWQGRGRRGEALLAAVPAVGPSREAPAGPGVDPDGPSLA